MEEQIKEPDSSQRCQWQDLRHVLKYKKLYLNLKKATLPEKGFYSVKSGVDILQTPLDTAPSKLLQLTLSGGRDWGSWISDAGGAFQPQTVHNFKLQLGNTGIFLLCKQHLAFLSRFQYFQHRKKKKGLLNKWRK